jgi:hypothetical protein
MSLSPSELEQYDRQMLVSGLGLEGQRKLEVPKVIVVGLCELDALRHFTSRRHACNFALSYAKPSWNTPNPSA